MPAGAASETASFASIPVPTYAWTAQTTNNLYTAENMDNCVYVGGYIYCMGGTSDSQTDVQYASVSGSGGNTFAWTSSAHRLASGEEGPSCVYASNGYLYCMGGGNHDTYVQYAQITGGSTSAWTLQANSLAVSNAGPACIYASNGYIYCMGGYALAGGVFATVQYANTYAGGGPTSSWQISANTLTAADCTINCATVSNYIYCMGGSNNPNKVQYAQVLGGGDTTAWATTNSLAAPTAQSSCIILSGYIYCMGGGSSGAPSSSVQYAQILPGGGTSTWTSQGSNTLAVSSGETSCVTANSYIYCLGGYNYGLGTYNTIQYALG